MAGRKKPNDFVFIWVWDKYDTPQSGLLSHPSSILQGFRGLTNPSWVTGILQWRCFGMRNELSWTVQGVIKSPWLVPVLPRDSPNPSWSVTVTHAVILRAPSSQSIWRADGYLLSWHPCSQTADSAMCGMRRDATITWKDRQTGWDVSTGATITSSTGFGGLNFSWIFYLTFQSDWYLNLSGLQNIVLAHERTVLSRMILRLCWGGKPSFKVCRMVCDYISCALFSAFLLSTSVEYVWDLVASCENDSVPKSVSFGNHWETINTEYHIDINAKPLFRAEVNITRHQQMAFMSHWQVLFVETIQHTNRV